MFNLINNLKNKLSDFKNFQFKTPHLIYLTLITSIGITIFLGIYDVRQYQREKYKEFNEISSRFHRIVNVYIESYTVLSHSTRAIFALTKDIDANDWRLFCNNIYQSNRYPGMIEMSFFKYLTQDSVASYAARELSLNDRILPPPQVQRSDYALLVYNLKTNEESFKGYGDNLFNYYDFNNTVKHLRDPAQTLITRTYFHNNRSTFFIFTPVFYLESNFRTQNMAKKQFLGWISVSIDCEKFFQNLIKISCDFNKMSIKVYEVNPNGTKHAIFSSLATEPVIFDRVIINENFGHKWEIHFAEAPTGYYIFKTYVPYTFFILVGIGLLITLITVLLIWSLTTTKQRALELAEQISYDFKRAELKHRRLVQNVSGVIFMCDPQINWKMSYVSDQFLEITGYPPEDFVNNKKRCFTDIVYPADIQQIEQLVDFKPVVGNKYFQEYRIIHADGSVKWIHERSQVVHDVMTGDNYLTGSFFDMTEQKRKEQEFRVLNNALKNAVGGTAFIGKDFKHVHANYAYARIFDVQPEQLVNVSLLNYINIKDHKQLKNELNKLDVNSEKIILNLRGISKLKESFFLNIVLVPAFQEALPHRLLGYYCFVKDTSVDVLREHALSEAVKSAEAANKTKSNFLASMSHELRTPLNAIIGYSDMIQEELGDAGPINPTLSKDLNKINDAGKHLLMLINDVLDVSKLEAGKMTVYLETFSVPEVCNAITEMMIPLANKKSNEIILQCPADIGVMHSDLTKVRQSLFNLLSNACKFTKNGTITVNISNQMIRKKDYILMSVIDTGIGIQADHIKKLFQPFTQADSSTTRDYGGTGLGLTITKRFCELLGGTLTVTSLPGQGATFTIRLPRTARVDKSLLS